MELPMTVKNAVSKEKWKDTIFECLQAMWPEMEKWTIGKMFLYFGGEGKWQKCDDSSNILWMSWVTNFH